jgi:hypothetical protein
MLKTKVLKLSRNLDENSIVMFDYPERIEIEDISNVPSSIDVNYTSDLNIIKIHNIIRKYFAYNRSTIDSYNDKILAIELINKSFLSINELRNLSEEIKNLNEKIDDIKTGKTWFAYSNSVKKHLLEYQDIQNNEIVCVSLESKEFKSQTYQRLKIIRKYLTIAKDYFNISILKSIVSVACCPLCNTPVKNFNIDENSGMFVCPTCGWIRENISKSINSFADNKTTNSSKNDYDNRENFYKTILRFAGKQIKVFHEKLEEDLDEYFTSINIGTCSSIRDIPLINGKKKGMNFKIMLKALTVLSKPKNKKLMYRKIYKEYYEDIWLLLHNYCGFDLNNIDHLINRLMEMYDVTQEVYNSMTLLERGGRDASLNTQFRLYVQLLACNYPCSANDFKLQKCRTSLELHQKNWQKMCLETGIDFYEII